MKQLLQSLDNENSNILLKHKRSNTVEVERFPPHMHYRNLVKRAIRTWKENFIAFFTTCDPAFAVNFWDLLIPQIELKLNHFRNPRIHPILSVNPAVYRAFELNRNPLPFSALNMKTQITQHMG